MYIFWDLRFLFFLYDWIVNFFILFVRVLLFFWGIELFCFWIFRCVVEGGGKGIGMVIEVDLGVDFGVGVWGILLFM